MPSASKANATGFSAAKMSSPRSPPNFTPRKGEQPITVANKLKPSILPAPFPDVVVRALRSALQSGGLGFPVLDVHATLIDATYDPERSTEPAFEAAASDAVAKAFSRENMLFSNR